MSFLVHLYDWVELYSIVLVVLITPLFFFGMGFILQQQYQWIRIESFPQKPSGGGDSRPKEGTQESSK